MAQYDLHEFPIHCEQTMQRFFTPPAVKIVAEGGQRSNRNLNSVIEESMSKGASPPNLPGYGN